MKKNSKPTNAVNTTKSKASRKKQEQNSAQPSEQAVVPLLEMLQGTTFSPTELNAALSLILLSAMRNHPHQDTWQLSIYAAEDRLAKLGFDQDVISDMMSKIADVLNEGKKTSMWPEGFFA